MITRPGVDTIVVKLENFNISSEAPLEVQPGKIKANGSSTKEDPLLYYIGSKPIRGKNSFLNKEFFQLDIVPKYQSEFISDDGSHCTTYVKASVPRLLTKDHNFSTVKDSEELHTALVTLRDLLCENGIHVSHDEWGKNEILRLDIKRDIPLNTKNFKDYFKILLNLPEGRLKNHRNYGSTVTMGNTIRTMTFYDKIEEILSKDKNKSEAYKRKIPRDTLRAELRALKKLSVKNIFNVNTLDDLISEYDKTISQKYIDNVRKHLPDSDSLGLSVNEEINIQTFKNLFLHFKDTTNRPIEAVFTYTALNLIYGKDKEEIVRFLRSQNMSKSQVNSLKQKMKNSELNSCLVQNNELEKYLEIKEKLLCP